MSKYESMSDFEINKLVAEHVGWTICEVQHDDQTCVVVINNYGYDTTVDYCNSWADMGSLLVEHNISIWPDIINGKWYARVSRLSNGFVDHQKTQGQDSPLRAAAIIYLESLEVSNA